MSLESLDLNDLCRLHIFGLSVGVFGEHWCVHKPPKSTNIFSCFAQTSRSSQAIVSSKTNTFSICCLGSLWKNTQRLSLQEKKFCFEVFPPFLHVSFQTNHVLSFLSAALFGLLHRYVKCLLIPTVKLIINEACKHDSASQHSLYHCSYNDIPMVSLITNMSPVTVPRKLPKWINLGLKFTKQEGGMWTKTCDPKCL